MFSWVFAKLKEEEIKEVDDLFSGSLDILCLSMLWGYASLGIIWVLSFIINIPLMTDNPGIVVLLILSLINAVSAGFGLYFSSKKIKNSDQDVGVLSKKRDALIIISFIAGVSIYVLTSFSGGFYWSPFTGYYSLIITTLSLCIGVWGNRYKQILKATGIVGVGLISIIFLSAFTDQIELQTTEKIKINNDLQKIVEIVNNFNLDNVDEADLNNTIVDQDGDGIPDEPDCNSDCNWNLEIVDYYSVLTKLLPQPNNKLLVLTGILSKKKQREIITKIKEKIDPNNDLLSGLEESIKNVGKRSRLFIDHKDNYKGIFFLVLLACFSFSIVALNRDLILKKHR